MFERGDSEGELGHWVKVAGAAVDKLGDKFWDFRASSPFCREGLHLLLTWNLSRQQQPKKACRL